MDPHCDRGTERPAEEDESTNCQTETLRSVLVNVLCYLFGLA